MPDPTRRPLLVRFTAEERETLARLARERGTSESGAARALVASAAHVAADGAARVVLALVEAGWVPPRESGR